LGSQAGPLRVEYFDNLKILTTSLHTDNGPAGVAQWVAILTSTLYQCTKAAYRDAEL